VFSFSKLYAIQSCESHHRSARHPAESSLNRRAPWLCRGVTAWVCQLFTGKNWQIEPRRNKRQNTRNQRNYPQLSRITFCRLNRLTNPNQSTQQPNPMKKRYTITCRNGNTVTVPSLNEAREICIHLHSETRITDQNGKQYPNK
jgi:hypothetical protein